MGCREGVTVKDGHMGSFQGDEVPCPDCGAEYMTAYVSENSWNDTFKIVQFSDL